ncbi:MAG: PQQ-binding-like beta-propeller repeat protein [Vicinamibacterales bacterium]
MKQARGRLAVGVVLALVVAAPVHAQTTLGASAQRLFIDRCSQCHDDGDNPAPDANAGARPAPKLAEIRMRQSPEAVYRLIDGAGLMAPHTKGWNTDDRRRVAEFITGKKLAAVDTLAPPEGRCDVAPPAVDLVKAPISNGWGMDAGNGRFQTAAQAGLPAASIPKLKLKWAFGYPSATHAYSQPTVAAGRVYVGSETGLVYAIDAKSGCYHWAFAADASVRTGIVIGASAFTSGGALIYFGDIRANVYAVDARTGTLVWRQKADNHTMSRITGTPTLADGRLYVPVSGVGEEAQAGNPNYECCSFRGSVVSLDAHTGTIHWKAYAIAQEPKKTGTRPNGVDTYAPAGASIWAAPTVDLARGAVYVGTGNGFTRPAADTTDAVLALSIKDGSLLWKRQLTEGDAVGGGPDFDIGASIILRTLASGKSVVVVGQKSGDVYALDPGNKGAQVWKVNLSKGALWGGIEWGMTADNAFVYVPISDYPMINNGKPPTEEAGLLVALRLDTGEKVWAQKSPAKCSQSGADCHPAKSAAISSTPDAILAGGLDGMLRAYSTKDGRVLWETDTAQPFTTVNNIEAKGGSLNGAGPAIAGGMVFVNSGYSFFAIGGNVLLAFEPDPPPQAPRPAAARPAAPRPAAR